MSSITSDKQQKKIYKYNSLCPVHVHHNEKKKKQPTIKNPFLLISK